MSIALMKLYNHLSEKERQRIEFLLTNNYSIRNIQKLLSILFNKKIYFNSIAHWIKNADKIVREELKERQKNLKSKELKIVEMDELFTYINPNFTF